MRGSLLTWYRLCGWLPVRCFHAPFRLGDISMILLRRFKKYDPEVAILVLRCLAVTISPMDHELLNATHLFFTLQRVLCTTLDEIALANACPADADAVAAPWLDKSLHRLCGSKYGTKAKYISVLKRVEEATTSLVVLLVVQVASCPNIAPVAFAGITTSGLTRWKHKFPVSKALRRLSSGPESLSSAVFVVLFNELQSALRCFQSTGNAAVTGVGTSRADTAQGGEAGGEAGVVEPGSKGAAPSFGADGTAANSLLRRRRVLTGAGPGAGAGAGVSNAAASEDGHTPETRVMTEIGSLLLVVSHTDVCRQALLRPEWMSLLLQLRQRGPFAMQRRVARLLRRLLPASSPHEFRARLPTGRTSSHLIAAPQFVDFLVQEVAAQAHPPVEQDVPTQVARTRLSESVALLRVLLQTPPWTPIVAEVLHEKMDEFITTPTGGGADAGADAAAQGGEGAEVNRAAAALACVWVLGGFVELLRPGGTAWLDCEKFEYRTGIVERFGGGTTAVLARFSDNGAGSCVRVRVRVRVRVCVCVWV